jgi:hypothetical protein
VTCVISKLRLAVAAFAEFAKAMTAILTHSCEFAGSLSTFAALQESHFNFRLPLNIPSRSVTRWERCGPPPRSRRATFFHHADECHRVPARRRCHPDPVRFLHPRVQCHKIKRFVWVDSREFPRQEHTITTASSAAPSTRPLSFSALRRRVHPAACSTNSRTLHRPTPHPRRHDMS